MKSSQKILVFGLLMFVFMSGVALAEGPSGLIPSDIEVRDGFEPGSGNPVGQVQMVRGEVLIIHEGMPEGYRAAEGLSLYTGDTIITTDTGRIRLRMLDGSLLTLASKTKLVINQSVFDPSASTRTSFFSMVSGKARFLVKKLVDYKRSDFEVKTKTAIVGVRGSDFAIIEKLKTTEVVAFDKTNIFIINLLEPDAEPVDISEFERAILEGGVLKKSKASPDMVESMKQEFQIPGKLTERSGKLDLHGGIRIPSDRLVNPSLIGTHGGGITDTYGANQKKYLESQDEINSLLEEGGKSTSGGSNNGQTPTGSGGTGGTGGTI